MKKLLLVALVLFVTSVKAQKKDFYLEKSSGNTYKVESARLIAKINLNSDTLHVLDFTVVKYIKIGDRVYKIESPTLTEMSNTLNYSSQSMILGNDTSIYKPKYWYYRAY